MTVNVLAFYVNTPGLIGERPRRIKLITKDNLATITAAGYLDSVIKSSGLPLQATDIVDTWYGATSFAVPGTYGVFTPTISSGSVTLNAWVNPADVLLPVTSGDFAIFNGTSGQVQDGGFSPTDATKAKVVMLNATPVVANNFAAFSATNGTVKDIGARVIANTTTAYGGGGTSNTFTATGLTVAAKGSAVIRASTNSVSITKALPGTDSLAITFSADPGAGTTVDYIYSTATLA